MKKAFITLTALVLLIYAANAQKKAQIGFTAGGALANYNVQESGQDQSANSKAGFTAGVIVNMPAGKKFMIQPGINWVGKGTQDDENGEKISITTGNIEVPVNFLYTAKKGFFVGGGPYAAFAVSGKAKAGDVSAKIHFGNSSDDVMKGFDFGTNVVTGYQSPKGFLIAMNFNQGLVNLAPSDGSNSTIKSAYIGLKLGYVLKGKKS